MSHFQFSRHPAGSVRTALKEGVCPVLGLLVITGLLVALFAGFLYLGRDMTPVIQPHVDDGEMVDPNPMRLVFMLLAFVSSFVLASVAERKGNRGKTLAAFWIGYAGGTLLWQSTGECAWHFSIPTEDYIMCFPHIEGASALILVIVTTILLVYLFRRSALSWGVWVFVLSFVGNWFGHFVQIGTYPLVSTLMEESQWFVWTGWGMGLLTCAAALVVNFFAARDVKARLCCALMLYFGIGIIVTGVAGL